MARSSFTSSGTPSAVPASSASPTMAFIGVRISWFMRDRNSLFDLLAASASSTFELAMAVRTRECIVAMTVVRMKRRTMTIAPSVCTGWVYSRSRNVNGTVPVDTVFLPTMASSCSSERLVTVLLAMVSRFVSAGFAKAKLTLMSPSSETATTLWNACCCISFSIQLVAPYKQSISPRSTASRPSNMLRKYWTSAASMLSGRSLPATTPNFKPSDG